MMLIVNWVRSAISPRVDHLSVMRRVPKYQAIRPRKDQLGWVLLNQTLERVRPRRAELRFRHKDLTQRNRRLKNCIALNGVTRTNYSKTIHRNNCKCGYESYLGKAVKKSGKFILEKNVKLSRKTINTKI